MKIYTIFIISFFPLFLYAQDIDKLKYKECSLTEAFENRQNNPYETQYYKSMAHFRYSYTINYTGKLMAIFYEDGRQSVSFDVECLFPEIQPFQVAILYYHFERGFEGGFLNKLDNVELTDKYFVVGTRYMVMENLRLRDKEGLSSGIIRTIGKDEWVTILEEGNEETIDGLTSIWVKVRLNYNNEGWCFGGYLGLDFLRE
jgi:hypothetical protein